MLYDQNGGYSVHDISRILPSFEDAIRGHASEIINETLPDGKVGLYQFLVENHASFKSKYSRILNRDVAVELIKNLNRWWAEFDLPPEFITDEELLGYPNIYFRVVRPFGNTDVGGIHADKWFWELGKLQFPVGYKRIKFWAPLLQNDEEPSLAIFPGSHLQTQGYSVRLGDDGRSRPFLPTSDFEKNMLPAPVRVGQCIIFEDQLLHCGRATDSPRVSIEFTMGFRANAGDP
jgi:hypothetical protein